MRSRRGRLPPTLLRVKYAWHDRLQSARQSQSEDRGQAPQWSSLSTAGRVPHMHCAPRNLQNCLKPRICSDVCKRQSLACLPLVCFRRMLSPLQFTPELTLPSHHVSGTLWGHDGDAPAWSRRGLGSFARAGEVSTRSCRSKSQWSQRSLKYKCPLFARKFRNTTARAVHDALIECEVRHCETALCL